MFAGEPSASPELRRVRVLNTQISNECTIQEVFCLRRSRIKNLVFYLLNVLTLGTTVLMVGFVWLLCYWRNDLNRRLRYEYCGLDRATHFQFLNWDDEWDIVRKEIHVSLDQDGAPVSRISFCNRFISYYYEPDKEVFCTARYQLGERLDELANDRMRVLTSEQRAQLLQDFGRNIIEVPVRSKVKLFLAEMLSPFEVFQFYAIVLWLCEGYYIFPCVLIVASLFTYIYNVQLLQQAQRKLKEDSEVRVSVDVLHQSRNGATLEQHIDSENLVPGDLFYIREGGRVPCDCVILVGGALLNQNYITGDNYPVRKVCVDNFVYRSDSEHEFTLYMGTEVMEVQLDHSTNGRRLRVPEPSYQRFLLCLATRTNYYSLRGQYLRSILYPKTHSFQFYSESIKFIFILLAITVTGYIIVCIRIGGYLPVFSMFVTLLDLISTSIPPTLPTAMSVGIGFAIQRLSDIDIKCTLPQKILVGGQVETVCFEKTGTLTKKEVSVVGFALCENGRITGVLTSPDEIKESRYAHTAFELMACCHSVSRSAVTPGNLGKPIDIAMLEFSQGVVVGNSSDIELLGRRLRLLKRFEFTHLMQRMGVVVMTDSSERKLFVKGDPEKILRNCRPQTIPANIHDYIRMQSEKGFKLMGLSARSLPDPDEPLDALKRLERDMLFLGILILENSLQSTSEETVRKLLASNVRTVIISGDSELTSGAVAFGCGMLDFNELVYCDLKTDSRGRKKIVMNNKGSMMNGQQSGHTAIKGEDNEANTQEYLEDGEAPNDEDFLKEFTFSLDDQRQVVYGMTGRLFEELYMKRNLSNLNGVFLRTILFSRMLPKHKAALLEHYEQIGRVTALVGENTRDASGFQQADLSLALTNSEMSSFAHFSSLNRRLSSIMDLLRVCRAGLSTNYQTFKMMCQFSLMEFTTMIVLYLHYEQLNNTENLYIDLFIMCPIFVTLSMTEPCDTLSKYPPPASLFSRGNLLSMLGLFVIQLLGQIFIVQRLKGEQFYTDSANRKLENLIANRSYNDSMMLSSTLFIFTNFLYMGVVLATSISKPFRKEFYTNPYLVANVLLLTVYNFAIPFLPQIVPQSMGIDQSNPDWYVFVVFWANIICLLMYVYERVLVWVVERFPEKP